MGKIMECGALCALPKGKTIIAHIQKDNFVLTPMNPIERCTPLSVCAHTMYEKTRPDLLAGPGGLLDLVSPIELWIITQLTSCNSTIDTSQIRPARG
jgi:hypothetical protein